MIKEISERFELNGKNGKVSKDKLLVIGVTLFKIKACADAKAVVIRIVAEIFIFSENSRRFSIEIYKSSHTFIYIL